MFCNIISKKVSTDIIYEDDNTIAIISKNMETFWHTLVIPKNHSSNIFDISESDLCNVMLTIKHLANLFKEKIGATWINILNANWIDAQQSTPHTHYHLIPRFPNDNLDTRPVLPACEKSKEDFLKLLKDV